MTPRRSTSDGTSAKGWPWSVECTTASSPSTASVTLKTMEPHGAASQACEVQNTPHQRLRRHLRRRQAPNQLIASDHLFGVIPNDAAWALAFMEQAP